MRPIMPHSNVVVYEGGTQKIFIKLTDQQVINILRYKKGTYRAPVNNLQVMMRIGVIVVGKKVQFTNLQRVCSVQLNGTTIEVPKKEPVNLMPAFNIIPDEENLLVISFIIPNFYVVKLFLGKFANIPDLIEKSWEPSKLQWYTKQNASISTEDDEDDVELTAMELSVTCPISKKLIKYPCRSEVCTHLNCFDLSTFLKTCANKRNWRCPICGKHLKQNSLIIDRFMQKILEEIPTGCTIVTLNKDGSWIPVHKNK